MGLTVDTLRLQEELKICLPGEIYSLLSTIFFIPCAICCAYAGAGVPIGSLNHEKDAIIGTFEGATSRSLVIGPFHF